MKVQGPRFDARTLAAHADEVRDAAYKQRDHAIALEKGEALLPQSDARGHLSFTARLLAAERGAADSPVDWDALPNLRRASPDEVEQAWADGKALYDSSYALHRLAQLGARIDEGDLERGSPRHELSVRTEIIGTIDELKDRLHGLGALGAQLDLGPLDALRALADAQRQSLLDTHGSAMILPDQFRGPPPVLQAGSTPRTWRLPKTRALALADVQRFEDAAGHLARLLGGRDLQASLEATRAKVPEPERPAFDRALAGFALLADEAAHAPNYQNKMRGGGHRQEYRGREVAGFRCMDRQHDSKARLRTVLGQVTRSKSPVTALSKKLVRELGRELGVPAAEVAKWKVDADAATRALADEVFVPLRALNDSAAGWMRRHRVPAEQTNRVVWDMTQAVVEGRFPRWRVDNAGSEAQLAHLDEGARQAWLTPMAIDKPTDVDGLTFHTQEATSEAHEIFWATKVGGPSHGFDVMPHCALACFINARNQVLLAKDPRWPNFAGRAYLRLFADPQTKAPVLFLEGMKKDFPYPRQGDLLERALVEHAMKKAEAMGAQLALSPYLAGHIEDMGLEGEWRDDARYELAPSLLVEAASIFGEHDWKATEREVRSMRNPQFFVAAQA